MQMMAHPQPERQVVQHVGPLQDQRLEQIAFDIFAFRFPAQDYWSNLHHAERSECRQIALKMAARLQAQWTIQTALEQLTEQSINVLFGDKPVDAKQRRIIEDFASSYLEDLVPLGLGDNRSESWRHVPENEPDDSELEDLGPKGRVQ